MNKIRGGKSKSKFEGENRTQYSGPESKVPTVADRRMFNDTAKGLTMPQAVLRIRDVYPGFWILIFTHSGSRISDLGSRIQKQQQKRGVKKICCHIFFCNHKFYKIVNYIFWKCRKKNLGWNRNYRIFCLRICR